MLDLNSTKNLIGSLSYLGSLFLFIALVLYTVFAFVLTRRMKIMTDNFKTPHAGFFTFVVRFHFFISVAVAIFAFLVISNR